MGLATGKWKGSRKGPFGLQGKATSIKKGQMTKTRILREVTWCNYGTALRVGGRGVLARSALPLVDDLADTASGK